MQIDGLAMGGSLEPASASVFVGFHHSRLFNNTGKYGVYFRYVDDTSVIFDSELKCDHSHAKLNLLHQALKFTVEKEETKLLEFLRCCGGERGHCSSQKHLKETTIYW